MPLDYATVKDWRFDEVRQRYDEKDAMLYALGIGLGQDPEDERQLRYVYERDLLAFPTMSVVLGYPGFWVRDPRPSPPPPCLTRCRSLDFPYSWKTVPHPSPGFQSGSRVFIMVDSAGHTQNSKLEMPPFRVVEHET